MPHNCEERSGVTPRLARRRRGGGGAAAEAAADTINLRGKIDLLEYADRSPITTYPVRPCHRGPSISPLPLLLPLLLPLPLPEASKPAWNLL